MAWKVGQQLQGGKYTIDKKLGEGGFSVTYLVRESSGRKLVIKTLNDTVQHRPDFSKFQEDFVREALRLAKCKHPNIVKIEDVFQEGILWCIALDYIDGEDLANLVVNQGILPEAEALRYIQQIGEALTVVHSSGLLHRDVKPQNIMLRFRKTEAVLIDFGIAREFIPNLTQTHTQFRTDGYAPIEQYEQRARRDKYTDVYALAATLYSLVTGKVPVPSPIRAYNIHQYKNDPLESPQHLNRSISDRINKAILKGMAVEPQNRPQTVQEWLRLLGVNVSVASTIHPTASSSSSFVHQQRLTPRGGFWLLWMLATSVGIFMNLVPIFGGAVLGAMQWLVLRRQIYGVGWRWILATTVGSTIGQSIVFIVGSANNNYVSSDDFSSLVQISNILTFVLLCAAFGALIGVMQCWVLRQQVRSADSWVLANVWGAVAFGIATILFSFLFSFSDIAVGITLFVLGPLIFGGITGRAMVNLLR